MTINAINSNERRYKMSEEIKRWPYDDENGGWNVELAENAIGNVYHFARLPKEAANILLKNGHEQHPDLFHDLFIGAVNEMQEIMNNKENTGGYHINHIVSGRQVYSLYDNSGYVLTERGKYENKEEAERAAEEYENSEVEFIYDKWIVLAPDEEVTRDMQDHDSGGTFVRDFDSVEEAEEAFSKLEHGYIVEGPADEWWAVIKNDAKKNVFNMMFPTRVRALAFLYREASPVKWMDYIRAKEER